MDVAKVADKYFLTDPWKVIEQGFNPDYARVSESVFALSNENLAYMIWKTCRGPIAVS
jgi:trehalose/maltose hydrolase-like predicted phosphorylase